MKIMKIMKIKDNMNISHFATFVNALERIEAVNNIYIL